MNWPRRHTIVLLRYNHYSRCKPEALLLIQRASNPENSHSLTHYISRKRHSLTQIRSPIFHHIAQRRNFGSWTALSPFLQVPLIFTGLVLTLWTYKCIMMVVFQNKIIYMPSMPPFARRERVVDYISQCGGVEWKEKRLRCKDGVEIALLVGESPQSLRQSPELPQEEQEKKENTIVLYFQGNGSSLPPRLPSLSRLLRALESPFESPNSKGRNPNKRPQQGKFTILALSYRGYWTSKGSPSEAGIRLDATAALEFIRTNYPSSTELILYGQSLGASVAAATAAMAGKNPELGLKIRGLILETPFASLKTMLQTLYPQRWLPYRYLYPFLRSRWDVVSALRTIGSYHRLKSTQTQGMNGRDLFKHPDTTETRLVQSEDCFNLQNAFSSKLRILIVQASHDEIVPRHLGEELETSCQREGLDVERRIIGPGTLHHEVLSKREGRMTIARFVHNLES